MFKAYKNETVLAWRINVQIPCAPIVRPRDSLYFDADWCLVFSDCNNVAPLLVSERQVGLNSEAMQSRKDEVFRG
ncbi:hypothetical protein BCEN4_700022 [Burkholderia cenocepacia]|uniref:hypothetical protein n=1 Tax=Burkholderia cenocepacia TaxID=95486 RepID=UPI00192C039C|nr:hypothetical protein [Burkholderia cenocepacia]CAD9227668.1 hypothetical protein BCEN4_700022 [Burkholderia cenocepacia]